MRGAKASRIMLLGVSDRAKPGKFLFIFLKLSGSAADVRSARRNQSIAAFATFNAALDAPRHERIEAIVRAFPHDLET